MLTKSALKVGISAVTAFVLFFAAWAYLSHLNAGSRPYVVALNDTKGLLPQTVVRMNGVNVGEVKEVRLRSSDLKPEVVLMITGKYRIPSNARIRITSGILITNPQIEIYWKGTPSSRSLAAGNWPDNLIDQAPMTALAQLSPEADAAVKSLTATMTDMAPRLRTGMNHLDSILKNADTMVTNLRDASGGVRDLANDPDIRHTLHGTLADLRTISMEARRTAQTMSVELRGVAKRNGGKVDQLMSSALELLQNFADTVDAARGVLTRLTEQVSDPRLQQSLAETVDLAKTTIARFSQIASDLHSFTGDAGVQSDLRSTVSTLRDTADEGQKIARKVGAIAERIHVPSGGPTFGIGQPSLSVDFLSRGDAPHFRSDLNVRFPIGKRNAFDLGLYDFAESNKLNMQYNTVVGSGTDLRYGIYAGKMGIGLDWGIAPGARLRLDGYNPNRLNIDARTLFRINDDFSAWIGVDQLFRKSTPVVGVQLKR